ncbi:MAG: anthranilate phosphoribosyltransferase [Pseudomonadota bacterium]
MSAVHTALTAVSEGGTLSQEDSVTLFDELVSGEASDIEIAALLMGLSVRGETVDEICGAVTAMRARMIGITAPDGAMDIVGTGGDRSGTYNISTCAAFIAAGAGVVVAKHGNGKLSSKCGSADVLGALGVRLDSDHSVVERCVAEAGIGFMFAPSHHPALKNVMPVRSQMKVRTIFNLLGPLVNPAGVRKHLIGVYDRRWLEPFAQVLRDLGSHSALIVHSADGLDEISTCAPTFCARLSDGEISTFEITPEEASLPRATLDQLVGGTFETNARALEGVLEGEKGPYRDVSIFNAAAALMVDGIASDWEHAAHLAAQSIDSGAARARLTELVATSNA